MNASPPLLLQFEYPGTWPRFFQDLIGAMSQGEGIVDMFCRILVAVDEDIVSLDIPRSQDESKVWGVGLYRGHHRIE